MTRFSLSAIAAVVLAAAVAAQQPRPFTSGIDAVYLDVTVLDRNNAIVTGLTKDDFEIRDEGVPHEVAVFSDAPAPISIGVLIDTSRSMIGNRIEAAVEAAAAVGRALRAEDLWSVYTFSQHIQRVIGWRPYDDSVVPTLRDVRAGGGTELFKSVSDMLDAMKSTPHRKRALLVITDGADNVVQVGRAPKTNVGPAMVGDDAAAPMAVDHSERAINDLRRGEVLLYALGLNWAQTTGTNSELHVPSLRRLAEPTGGALAVVANHSAAALAAQRLADELRQQYTLGFYPQKAPDGKYRRLTVTAKNPAYRIRTRAGYLATRPR